MSEIYMDGAAVNWDAEQLRAAKALAGSARDATECRDLLMMLGLLEKPKRKRGRPRKEFDHGEFGRYSQGCRCDECRAANSERCGARRQQAKTDPSRADRAGHGKASTYKNHSCRCKECCAAHSQQMKEYKAARRARERAAA